MTNCGHKLLSIIIRIALILLSTRDPTSRFSVLGGTENIAAAGTGVREQSSLLSTKNSQNL